MEVRNCRGCGRLYNYIGGSYKNLCPLCIIELENKLDSEECENLKKMLMSNDEASVTLAKEIIDNLETA